MPETGWPSLIAEAHRFLTNLPLICMSGYAELEFRDKLDGLEDVYLLTKPNTLKELIGAVKHVIR